MNLVFFEDTFKLFTMQINLISYLGTSIAGVLFQHKKLANYPFHKSSVLGGPFIGWGISIWCLELKKPTHSYHMGVGELSILKHC